MKQTIQISAPIIFILLAVFPLTAMSEVKITLRNGREIIAVRCTDSAGKLNCEKSDGTFRIDKKDVLNMKKITIERREAVEEEAPAAPSPDGKKDEPSIEAGKTGEKAAAKAPVGEQEKRLAELNAKRAAYEAEREALSKEREELREEVKAAGMIYNQERYLYFQQKLNDMDVRIKAFNEKVDKLNEEIAGSGGPAKEEKVNKQVP